MISYKRKFSINIIDLWCFWTNLADRRSFPKSMNPYQISIINMRQATCLKDDVLFLLFVFYSAYWCPTLCSCRLEVARRVLLSEQKLPTVPGALELFVLLCSCLCCVFSTIVCTFVLFYPCFVCHCIDIFLLSF